MAFAFDAKAEAKARPFEHNLVRIYDYVDVQVPVLSRMFAKRLRGYRSLGYAQGEAPAGFGEIDDDFILGRDWAEIDGEDEGTE